MQKLAKREEEIMQILWKLEKGFIKADVVTASDIIENSGWSGAKEA